MPHSEIDTLPIVAHALSQGKRVFVPHIPEGGRMRMLQVYEGENLDAQRDKWGIPVVGLEREDKSRRNCQSPPAKSVCLVELADG
jgi:5-formyltetrahydrofolate cyclo-ligase